MTFQLTNKVKTNLLWPNCNDPCMWLFLAGEGGFTGSSSLKDPVESKANVFNPLIPKKDQREKMTQKSQILLFRNPW